MYGPRAVREQEPSMRKTAKPLKLRKLNLDKETLRKLALGASAVPVKFTDDSCVVSQCKNTCSNIFETCA
jgi:hypothetical protein